VTIDFKGNHFPKSVILYAVFFYVCYGVSYRDLEEIMAERGVEIDHATLNRWVVKFLPLIAANAQARKKPTAISWRMDETYIKVRGKWTYLYRAVDRDGPTLDFMLSERRDTAAARRFFKRAVGTNGIPDRIAIDKSGANLAGLQSLNIIETVQSFVPWRIFYAIGKQSSNMIANWLLTACHSRTERFHSTEVAFSAR
jgi:putative transposase